MDTDAYLAGAALCEDCGVQEPAETKKGRWSVCVECHETRQINADADASEPTEHR